LNNWHHVVTTIIPTYKRPDKLKEAIHSVLSQTYPYVKVCVYDNASGDETASVVQSIAKSDKRVVYHCHPANIGSARNFLYGMDRVDSPFFSFLSDDDKLLPNFYEDAVSEFSKFPDSMFVSMGTIITAESGKVIRNASLNKRWAGYYPPPEGLKVILKGGMVALTGILFRKSVIEKVGLISVKQCLPTDLEYILKVSSNFPVIITGTPGAIYKEHPNTMSSVLRLESIWPCFMEIINAFVDEMKHGPEIKIFARKMLIKRLKRYLVYIVIASLQRGDIRDAKEAIGILLNNLDGFFKAKLLSLVLEVYKLFPFLIQTLLNLLVKQRRRVIIVLDYLDYISNRFFAR